MVRIARARRKIAATTKKPGREWITKVVPTREGEVGREALNAASRKRLLLESEALAKIARLALANSTQTARGTA
jgi:hypothetical protein